MPTQCKMGPSKWPLELISGSLWEQTYEIISKTENKTILINVQDVKDEFWAAWGICSLKERTL